MTVSAPGGSARARERIEDHRLLAVARRRGDPDRTRFAEARRELAAQRLAVVGDGDVELEIAGDDRRRRAQRRESRRVGVGLRRDAGERARTSAA